MNPANNINYFFLNQLCIYAQLGREQELMYLGLPPEQIKPLMNMTITQLEAFSRKLNQSFLVIDTQLLGECLGGVEIPTICRELLIHGASNDVLKKLYHIPKNTCSDWRSYVHVPPLFKNRVIPIKGYKKLWDGIYNLKDPDNPSAEELIRLAKTNEVGIGAIWTDIKNGEENGTNRKK